MPLFSLSFNVCCFFKFPCLRKRPSTFKLEGRFKYSMIWKTWQTPSNVSGPPSITPLEQPAITEFFFLFGVAEPKKCFFFGVDKISASYKNSQLQSSVLRSKRKLKCIWKKKNTIINLYNLTVKGNGAMVLSNKLVRFDF